MGEPRRSCDVPNRVNTGKGSFITIVNFNPTSVSELWLLASRKNGRYSDGDQAAISGDFLTTAAVLDGDSDRASVVTGPGDLGIGEAIDASFAVALCDGIADIIIFDWKEVGHHFNNGDLSTKGIVNITKFYSDCTSSDDDHRFGLLFKSHRFLGGNHSVPTEGKARHRA